MALCLSIASVASYAQSTLKGTVKDAQGEPMIGVTINMDGKPAAITDIDGNFSIPNAKPSSKITVSYVGYKNQTVTVGNQTNFVFTLKEDNETLNEVVVVGYGTMKKSDLTGSISSVGTEKLNAKGATSIIENLQGATPGVNITQNSSRAGGGFDIEIRGKSTLGSNKTPLYVVDGIITDNIDFLNPQDIERIDILKDASSTAIYGSRATNGVVIVTTKGAQSEGAKNLKPTISYEGYYGITKTTRMPDFMSGSEFAQYRMLRYENAMTEKGGTTLGTYGAQNYWSITDGNYKTAFLTGQTMDESYVKSVIANGQETNWRDLFLRTGAQQNHFLSVSGASGNVSYHFGGGYQNEKGIYQKDEMERFNLKGAIDSKLNNWLSAGINFNGAYTNNNTIADNAISQAFRLNTLCRAYDDNGDIIVNPGMAAALGTSGDQFTSTANPLLDLENTNYNTKTYQVLANLYLQIHPIKDLTFKTTFSPSYTHSRNGKYEGVPSTVRGTSETTENHAYAENTNKFQWTWDNQIDYNHTWGDHKIGVMGLYSASKFTQETYDANVYKVPAQELWYNLGSATSETVVLPTSGYTEWTMQSFAARLNYSYKDRYLFTGTIRTDGSSRFADGHRWGTFPSAAFGWRISEEPWMKNTKNWLHNLKFRLSYGVTGNNYTQGTNYPTYVVASGGSAFYGFSDGTGNNVYYPSAIVNKNLTWEKTSEFDVGLDFGFLNGRISGTLDFYNRTSKDKILEVNGGKENDIENSFFVGESINALYNYRWSGIVSDKTMTVPNTQIAIDKGFTPGQSVVSRDYYYACYGWGEGMPIIDDLNGDGAISSKDKTIVGKSNPSWTGSISSTLSYKNWDFSFSIYTKQNYQVYSPFYNQYCNYGDRGMQHINIDYYIPAGTLLSCDFDEDGNRINEVYQETTHYGSFPFPTNQSDTNAGAGTYLMGSNAKSGTSSMSSMKTANSSGTPYQIVDASYWKVKNISLGYTFPKSVLQKSKVIRSLRLYVNITNPFVWGSDYKGFDPEWASSSLSTGGPSTVTYQFGASVKF
ncbi:SusC/RagA family TonB-linked outer membrane protein [Segatella bryantii]|uniref:SusC/RagA family TonB-linked outer membrane protein n=1 Tax=Segatella bryantii TaxID=77095 RepID=UPI0015A3DF97|nr:TonB-dependent receptor [Segatella bryantii]